MPTVTNMNKFSEWLDAQMQAKNLSQSQLAKRAGVTRSAINGILREARGPGVDLLQGLARALDIPIEEVYRAASILPPKFTKNELIERIIHEMNGLPPEDKQDVMDYIEMIRQRTEKRRKKK